MILLVGTGYMAQEYAKVLIAQKKDFITIGRSKKKCEIFKKKFNTYVVSGGLNLYLAKNNQSTFNSAIVATNIECLHDNALDLIQHGVLKILLEKPGSQNIEDLIKLHSFARSKKAKIYIAYNRRFYGSTINLKKRLLSHSNLSARLEITEFEHLIRKSNVHTDIKKTWLLANTSHVLDLAFYLIGKPRTFRANHGGMLSWHKHSIFCGSGVTDSNSLFTYHGHWGSVGRWGIEIFTKKKKFVLQPLEELKIYNLDNDHQIIDHSNNYDKEFKPGLFLMLKDFMKHTPESLPNMTEHLKFSKIVYKIASYE